MKAIDQSPAAVPPSSASCSREEAPYFLDIPGDGRRSLSAAWLWLGIASVLASGLFSVLLVLSRTPYVQNAIPWVDFFHTALVVHVDLSVLVWFLAFAGVFWTLNSSPRLLGLGWLALALAAAGAVVITVAPFAGAGGPLMSNYIPVLQHPLFFTGLLLFAAGIALLVLRGILTGPAAGSPAEGAATLRFGTRAALLTAALALGAFAWSYAALPASMEGNLYYELLFWGGGHTLQFTYTLLVLVAWLWLACASGARLNLSPRIALLFFALGTAPVFLMPVIYYFHDVASSQHVVQLTWLMAYGGGLAALPMGLAVAYGIWRGGRAAPEVRPLRAALVTSLALFGIGGGIGFLIQGSDVTIPAHYHGSIVGVTLAFMGLTYYLLPQLGFGEPAPRLARLQPYVYGGGQLLHVLGLVWSGGYGVQRKVAGSAQVLDTLGQKAGMGLMGLGGLIAIIGGFMFLLAVLRALRRPA